jgi:hypothetical protein
VIIAASSFSDIQWMELVTFHDLNGPFNCLIWVLLLAHLEYWAVEQASWDVIPPQPRELECFYLTSGFLQIWCIALIAQLVVALTYFALSTAWFWVLLLAHLEYWAVEQASWDVIPPQPRELEWLYLASGFLQIWGIELVAHPVFALT